MKAFLIVVEKDYEANSVKNHLHHTRGIDQIHELSEEDLDHLDGVIL